jgi:hypothetical protein
MGTLLSAILADLWPVLIAIVGALGWGLHQRRAGAKAEQAKRADERLKARAEADRIEDAIAGRDPDENRKELRKWSGR